MPLEDAAATITSKQQAPSNQPSHHPLSAYCLIPKTVYCLLLMLLLKLEATCNQQLLVSAT
jgi:hypothetical protein